ncbi:tRNA dihydrouridine(20/20a) synthase DusA [Azospirillum sp. RWY-5-1]|uniref:tRNA-dihydrouridine(20/20a) synthase n=2 Tax=Azospirillum oleiclasticum TaxID=2735135 RepID=A0ABX2TC23_9PROT|nr:tRNA dihydrouridine(20/20a) synthase DusA [Azospirillum oleiclasticum]NYZ21884.1 tRNA dihydrouridine(20/20a) synthase DusA [Azospirillum oleiclasticum]
MIFQPHRLAVAPMMDWTDRHCRFFHRLLTRRTLLYTEMVTTGAILHGDRERLLGFDPAEHPVALQIGGSDPADLAASARIGEEWGYDEINLNVGCPSDRVQSGRFGACLMAEPDLVARCVGAMRDAVRIPVTVKSRIAIDAMEEWPTLEGFVRTVSAAGCTRFVVHARKAWLKGLSPKENRDVPPLRYDLVHRLKAEFPHLDISINGGIRTLAEAQAQLAHVDGVMIGRAAYETPFILADADRLLYGESAEPPDAHAVVRAMLPYVEAARRRGAPLSAITRHMLGLFQGRPGARAWRRHLSENAHRPGAGPDLLLAAAAFVPEAAPLARSA